MRRGNPASEQLLERAVASRSERRNLLDHLQSDATDQECLAALESSDPVVVHTAIRGGLVLIRAGPTTNLNRGVKPRGSRKR